MGKKGLGRGLGALLPSSGPEGSGSEGGVREIPVREIVPNRFQPRQRFDPEKLAELAESIRQHGVVQPVVVRPVDDHYELIVGERRWRAAQAAGLHVVPAVVKDLGSDEDVMAVALVENLQREDLNPLEEASAYQYLVQEFGLTQEEVAQRVGRSRSQVTNTLRLLQLDADVQEAIQIGTLTMGHAKAILGVAERAGQMRLFREVVARGLSVRQAEELARQMAATRPASPRPSASVVSPWRGVEEQLRNSLGTKVVVKGQAERGRVEIEYYSAEDLARIVDIIAGKQG